MGAQSKIEWTDATWPVVQGCDPVSQGCVHCYAVPLLWRMAHNPERKISAPLQGVTEKYVNAAGNETLRFTGKVALREDRLDWPLRWQKPRMIFVPSHGDLFHTDVPDRFIDHVFQTVEQAPWHTYQILTKRSERMRDYMLARFAAKQRYADAFKNCPTPEMRDSPAARDARMRARPDFWKNIWLGVSVEDQANADARIPHLLATPAAVRFVSLEPLLGPIDLTCIRVHLAGESFMTRSALYAKDPLDRGAPEHALDWVIVGGESGKDARPMHPAWARSLRDQCASAGVPFFFKQWGSWAPGECAPGPQTRTERVAYLFDNNWDFSALTPRVSQETHIEDGPDVWWFGKKAAGRLLDGVEHNGMPHGAATKAEAV